MPEVRMEQPKVQARNCFPIQPQQTAVAKPQMCTGCGREHRNAYGCLGRERQDGRNIFAPCPQGEHAHPVCTCIYAYHDHPVCICIFAYHAHLVCIYSWYEYMHTMLTWYRCKYLICSCDIHMYMCTACSSGISSLPRAPSTMLLYQTPARTTIFFITQTQSEQNISCLQCCEGWSTAQRPHQTISLAAPQTFLSPPPLMKRPRHTRPTHTRPTYKAWTDQALLSSPLPPELQFIHKADKDTAGEASLEV